LPSVLFQAADFDAGYRSNVPFCLLSFVEALSGLENLEGVVTNI
jgi:hypothetical protein